MPPAMLEAGGESGIQDDSRGECDEAKKSSLKQGTINSNNGPIHHSKVENGIVWLDDSSRSESSNTAHGGAHVLAERGMKCEPKRLWEEKLPSGDEVNWVDKIPEMVSVAPQPAMDRNVEYALLLRTQSKNGKSALHSIVVQSPLLKGALKDILQDYPGISLCKDPLIFESPFKPFVHRWDLLKTACEQNRETETGHHLELLKSALEPELEGVFSIIKDFATDGAIEFNQLWTVFAPGSTVISTKGKSDRGFNLIKTELFDSKEDGKTYFILQCFCIDWDGTRLGAALEHLAIREFEGNATPSDLTVYPLAHHPKKNLLVEKLTQRGKKFQEYAGTLNKTYDGVAVDRSGRRPVSYHVRTPRNFL